MVVSTSELLSQFQAYPYPQKHLPSVEITFGTRHLENRATRAIWPARQQGQPGQRGNRATKATRQQGQQGNKATRQQGNKGNKATGQQGNKATRQQGNKGESVSYSWFRALR